MLHQKIRVITSSSYSYYYVYQKQIHFCNVQTFFSLELHYTKPQSDSNSAMHVLCFPMICYPASLSFMKVSFWLWLGEYVQLVSSNAQSGISLEELACINIKHYCSYIKHSRLETDMQYKHSTVKHGSLFWQRDTISAKNSKEKCLSNRDALTLSCISKLVSVVRIS